MMEPPANEIERIAAEWAAKVDGGTLPAADMAAFEAWLATDPRHLGAYLKIEAALARVSRLGAEAERQRQAADVVSLDAARSSRRRFVLAGALAASFAAVIASGVLWQANRFSAIYETRIGEMKTVALPDGSSLTLNTGTTARVHYTLLARGVSLDRGEALFDVAKNKSRPFVVTAGSYAVRAVGTSFSVSKVAQQPFTVTVREGTVAISMSNAGGVTMVSGGERAVAQADGSLSVGDAQLARDFAWLDGRISFRQEPLGSVVRAFERYSTIRIIIDDPQLARRTVTGAYVATDPAGFARAVAVFMDLQLETDGGKLYLKQKKS